MYKLHNIIVIITTTAYKFTPVCKPVIQCSLRSAKICIVITQNN